jgi:lysophospholipase L1-like esterase
MDRHPDVADRDARRSSGRLPQRRRSRGLLRHSITEQLEYTARVEEFVLSRFPSMHVTFIHAGVGGDRVSGGSSGTADERLDRDVIPFKPTVVTIMLGMNDGGYKPLDEPTLAAYAAGYRHILNRLKQALPGVRLTLIQPSPYDDVTRPAKFDGGYNAVLHRYPDLVRTLGREYSALIVDFNTPVVDGLQRVGAVNSELARQILPDRVHPASAGHWLMAEALLRAWKAPAIVSSVHIDAAASRLVGAENTTISALTATTTGLRWQQRDKALPIPNSSTMSRWSSCMRLADAWRRSTSSGSA